MILSRRDRRLMLSYPSFVPQILSFTVGKLWAASCKRCDIAEIGDQRTADIFTDSTKELAARICCTETANVDQWKIDICFPPGSGDRGVSGL